MVDRGGETRGSVVGTTRPADGVPRDAEGWPVSPAKPAAKSPVDESTPRLLAMLAHAMLHLGFNRLSLETRQRLVSVLGMTALLIPLFLWMAWTKFMLVLLSIIGVLCVGALLLIVWLSPEDEL